MNPNEKTKCLVDESLASICSCFGTGRAENNRNHAHPIALRRCHQAVTGIFCVPCLQTIDGVIAPKQGIAVALLNVVVGEFFDSVPCVVVRKFLDNGTSQRCEIAGCCYVILSR